jgi:hypothetical protein
MTFNIHPLQGVFITVGENLEKKQLYIDTYNRLYINNGKDKLKCTICKQQLSYFDDRTSIVCTDSYMHKQERHHQNDS